MKLVNLEVESFITVSQGGTKEPEPGTGTSTTPDCPDYNKLDVDA